MIAHITTAPRPEPTLGLTLRSLAAARITTAIRPDANGNAFAHWIDTARSAVKWPYERALIVQDDILVARGLGPALMALKWPNPNWGCLSLYCPAKYAEQGTGWVEHWGYQTWGACALLFPRDVLARIVELPRAKTWPTDRGIDRFVGEALADLGLHIRYHAPSLVQHIGNRSTMTNDSAAGWRAAADFVGEDCEEIQWPSQPESQPSTGSGEIFGIGL